MYSLLNEITDDNHTPTFSRIKNSAIAVKEFPVVIEEEESMFNMGEEENIDTEKELGRLAEIKAVSQGQF